MEQNMRFLTCGGVITWMSTKSAHVKIQLIPCF